MHHTHTQRRISRISRLSRLSRLTVTVTVITIAAFTSAGDAQADEVFAEDLILKDLSGYDSNSSDGFGGGNDLDEDLDEDVPSITPTGHDFIQVAATDETCYALRKSGQIERWDAYERLPLNIDEVGLGGVLVNSRFKALIASKNGVCATKRSGLHTCWGDLWFDALGTETQWQAEVRSVNSDGLLGLTPEGDVACIGDASFCDDRYQGHARDVACSDSRHCCALLDSGRARCWNHDGSGINHSQRVAFTQISIQDEVACGVRTDGRLLCWSLSDYAEQTLYTPAGDDFISVVTSQGGEEVCAVRRGGALLCWAVEGPVAQVAGGVQQAALGYNTRCLLHTDGSVSSTFDVDIDDPEDPVAFTTPVMVLTRAEGLGGLSGLLSEDDDLREIPEALHLGAVSLTGRADPDPEALGDDPPGDDPPEGAPVEGAPVAWAIRAVEHDKKPRAWVGFDPLTGKPRWEVKALHEEEIICALQSGDAALIVSDGEAVAVDAKTGHKRWALARDTSALLCTHTLSPDHSAGFAHVTNDRQTIEDALGEDADVLDVLEALTLIDPKTGRQRWLKPIASSLQGADEIRLWVDSEGVLSVGLNLPHEHEEAPKALCAFAAKDGALTWRLDAAKGEKINTFIVTGDVVWVASVEVDVDGNTPDDSQYRFHLRPLNRADGAPHPTAMPSTIDAPPDGTLWLIATPSDLITVTSADGVLRVIDPVSGAHRWSWGLGEGVTAIQALTSSGGAWLAARTDYDHVVGEDGVLLVPLHDPPTQAPVTVTGTLPEHWGPLIIGGQRVTPFPMGQFSVELRMGGALIAYGSYTDCAAGEGGEVRRGFVVTQTTGQLWLPLEWSTNTPTCP